MMYGEFMARMEKVNGGKVKDISIEEYQIIERVYNYHPRYEPYDGKLLAAKDYSRYGIIFFVELLPVADRMAELTCEVWNAQAAVKAMEQQVEKAKQQEVIAVEKFTNAKGIYKDKLEYYIEELETKLTNRRY